MFLYLLTTPIIILVPILIDHYCRKGCFNSGDILVAVNEQSVIEMLPKDVLALIDESQDKVILTIRREMINNFGMFIGRG